jgi:hypothetical protein
LRTKTKAKMSKDLNFDFTELLGSNVEFTEQENPHLNVEIPPEEPSKKKKEVELEDDIEFIRGAAPKEETGEEIEEEEVSEEVKNTPLSDDTKENKDASGSFALAFAKFQQDRGVISDFNEEELLKIEEESGEVGMLEYLLDKSRESIFEEAKKMYAADKEELAEYFDLKDIGVDTETAKELAYQKGHFGNITEEDLTESEDLRRKVIEQHYKMTTNFNESKIKKLVENIFNLGEDETEAIEALEVIKESTKKQIEEVKKQTLEQQKMQQKLIEDARENMKKLIYETDEIIKGQKINKQTQKKLEEMILQPAAKDANGNALNAIWAKRAENPQEFDLKVAYLLHTGVFDGKMDKLKSKTKTEVVTGFEEMLRSKNQSQGGKTVTKTQGDTSLLDEFLRGN